MEQTSALVSRTSKAGFLSDRCVALKNGHRVSIFCQLVSRRHADDSRANYRNFHEIPSSAMPEAPNTA
jgi:hypothetical protein